MAGNSATCTLWQFFTSVCIKPPTGQFQWMSPASSLRRGRRMSVVYCLYTKHILIDLNHISLELLFSKLKSSNFNQEEVPDLWLCRVPPSWGVATQLNTGSQIRPCCRLTWSSAILAILGFLHCCHMLGPSVPLITTIRSSLVSHQQSFSCILFLKKLMLFSWLI